ncbi:hypothetical protein [Glycomyces paridis]|uniref:Uncharacterized protein n=1 Tax=Glycomyces paridis TaxID=2126555 RepID=A0A4S8P9Z3_9ACTN|nr:hypothetical protein [Glycomyces paridis]THV25972.1 hypothetical protein E9998_19760 [Glycomyces paridis]
MTDRNDLRALDLLKCLHWGRQLTAASRMAQAVMAAPVIDTEGLCDDYTPVEYLRVLVDAAAADVVERPEDRPVEPEDLEYELQTIAEFRAFAEHSREAGRLAELIADMLQAPYNEEA